MRTEAKYLGATQSELDNVSASRRVAGYADQRKLFPHSGALILNSEALVLEGWREISRSSVEDVSLTFTETYRRKMAGGWRGQYASFGLFGSLGKPILLTLRGEEPVYLLIDFRWSTGTNKAKAWAPEIADWAAGAHV